jgi:esterase
MLSFDSISPPSPSSPTRIAFVLHGILGSAQNWRSFIRRLAPRFPDTSWLLVDLRNHGDSTLPEHDPPPPPHTLTACAEDLETLASTLPHPVELVVGHSFGGKVGLVYAERAAVRPDCALREVWSLDAPPGALPADDAVDTDVHRVLASLRRIPLPIASREALVETLRGFGHSANLALWMTTNLRPAGDSGFTWRFDLTAIEAMMRDFYRTDLVPFLTAVPSPLTVHVVRAGRSDRWPDSLWSRLTAAAAEGDRLRLHILENAGHWLHVDAPEALLDLLAS